MIVFMDQFKTSRFSAISFINGMLILSKLIPFEFAPLYYATNANFNSIYLHNDLHSKHYSFVINFFYLPLKFNK